MLDLAVLGLLNESPMHGYELRKQLSALLGRFRAFSYGSLYPTLRRLADAGYISEESPAEDAGGLSRRGRRVYRITAEGKEHLAELLADVGPDAFDEEGFGARLAFFAHTRSDVRLQILEGRRRRVEEQRDGLRSSLSRAGERLDRYTRQLHEHGLESVDREVRWLTELIESERSTPPDPPRRSSPSRPRPRPRQAAPPDSRRPGTAPESIPTTPDLRKEP